MTLYDQYKANGWQLCDIPSATKGPTAPGWNLKGAQTHGLWGLGLCHAYSGTCTLDIDNYPKALDWFHERGIDLDALLADPAAVQIVSGKVNRAKLLYKLETPMASCSLGEYRALSAKSGKEETFHAIELRCATRDGKTVQDVLPPSIHPDTGKPYIWAYGDETFGHWSNLPALPSAVLALWQAQQVSLPAGPKVAVEAKGSSTAEIVKLLESKDPNECAYDEWLKVGMAVHHETGGSAAGYALWCEWSARCPKHDTTHMPTKWRSFDAKTDNPVTLGSLRREQTAPVEAFDVVEVDVGEDTRLGTRLKRLLDDRIVWVRSQEAWYDLEQLGHPWMTDRGLRILMAPYLPLQETTDAKGNKKEAKVDPVTWLKNSPDRHMVDMAGMHPGAGRIYSEDGLSYVNSYVRTVVEPLTPLASEKEAFAFMWSRMRDPIFREWLLKFYAYALQNPGVKIQCAPLLVSAAQGTGKNTIMKVLPEILFGSRYVRSMSGSVLGGQFNDAIGSTWWLYLEELRAGANKADRMHTTNKIKSWVTDNTIEVHKKGMAPYDIRNRVQITATSNFDDALQLDNNDRRWAIGEMLGPLTAAESMDLYGFLLSNRAAGVLRHIFGSVNTAGFKPSARAPDTMAKRDMIVAGIGGWEGKLVEAMVAGDAPFDRDVFRLKDVLDLMMGSGVSRVMLSRMLKREMFRCEQLVNGRNERLWAWRNVAFWQNSTEGERLQHMQAGNRSAGCPAIVPAHILAMSAEGGVDSNPNADLLG